MTKRATCTLAMVLSLGLVTVGAQDFDPVTMDLPAETIDSEHPPALVELAVPSHGELMGAILYTANGPGPHPTLALLHGFPGNEQNLDLAQALRRSGFNVLFFHYRGAWGSGGTYSVAGELDDVAVALDFLREPANAERFRIDRSHVGLVGHSLGGFAALRVGAERPEVVCTVAMAPADLVATNARRADFDFESPAARAPVNGLGGYTVGDLVREVRANLDAFALVPRVGGFSGRAVFIVSAKSDEVVPLAVQTALADAARDVDDVDFEHVVMPGDHSFSTTRIELLHRVVGWTRDHCR